MQAAFLHFAHSLLLLRLCHFYLIRQPDERQANKLAAVVITETGPNARMRWCYVDIGDLVDFGTRVGRVALFFSFFLSRYYCPKSRAKTKTSSITSSQGLQSAGSVSSGAQKCLSFYFIQSINETL